MKKFFIFLVVVVILIFLSNKIYQYYSRNYINSHEAIVLINDFFSEKEVDAFFNLKKGTYDSTKHMIVYSLIKRDAYLLDTYINLPVKYKNGGFDNGQFNCNLDYLEIKPFGFYNYEIGNSNIIARIIAKDASVIKQLNEKQLIAEKQLGASYKYGKVTVLDVDKNGVNYQCK